MKTRFELVGLMPLIMHQDDVEMSDLLAAWRKDPANKNLTVAGDDRSPPWTWQTYLYSDGQHVTIPVANLMVALRQAGAQIILKKQKTMKEISQSGLSFCSEYLNFYCRGKQIPMAEILTLRNRPFEKQAEEVQKLGFRLFIKRARIGQQKHIRVRPRFDVWSITGEVEVLAKEITFEVLEKLFELAGRAGLGDWRPGCRTPGPYGMFAAKLSR